MEITSMDQLDLNATYSYADYLKWLVEPDHHLVLVYRLNEEGRFIDLKPFTESENLRSGSIDGFEVLASDIFDV